MKYDVIIIGGGLAGLTCGIALQQKGKSCLIVSSGQNAMHFFSGAAGLLTNLEDGTPIENPLEGIKNLSAQHPYSIIGTDRSAKYLSTIKDFLAASGIATKGTADKNGLMLTPAGNFKRASIVLDDFDLINEEDSIFKDKSLIVNIAGYLDFNTSFIAEGIEKKGGKCRISAVRLEELERVRKSPSEMRSVNIAKLMDNAEIRHKFVSELKKLIKDEKTVILPAVFGLTDDSAVREIRNAVSEAKIVFAGTMPPSVPGIRTQAALKNRFTALGGTILNGDTVTEAVIDKGNVSYLRTNNLEEIRLEADSYVLATGSFFSKGLWATPDKVQETLMDLDVHYTEGRASWYSEDFFGNHSYLGFGVKTDSSLHPSKNGSAIGNLYAIGSVLGGYDPIKEGSGAGVAMATALAAADEITANINK